MQLTYSSVPDDLMAFNRYVIKRSPSRKRLFVFFLAVVVCIAVVMTAVAYFSRPDTLAWAVIAVIWSMMIAFWPLLIHWTGEWAVRKCVAEGFLAEQITATFTDEGVRLTSPTIESRTRWGAVTKVVEPSKRSSFHGLP